MWRRRWRAAAAAGPSAAKRAKPDAPFAPPLGGLLARLSSAALGPSYAAVQRLAGPSRRATAAATYLFVVNLLGLGLGATVIGWLSDRFAVRAGAEALRMAILAVLVCYPCAALLYGFAATRFEAEERGG